MRNVGVVVIVVIMMCVGVVESVDVQVRMTGRMVCGWLDNCFIDVRTGGRFTSSGSYVVNIGDVFVSSSVIGLLFALRCVLLGLQELVSSVAEFVGKRSRGFVLGDGGRGLGDVNKDLHSGVN